MRPIDAGLLETVATGCDRTIVAAIVPFLVVKLPAAGVTSPLRIAHFLSQCAVETWWFRRLVENLNYTAPRIVSVWPRMAVRSGLLAGRPEALANAVYAGVNGNGDEASGDGWKFRGRGGLNLTGRFNYRRAGAMYEADPDLVATPEGAIDSAVSYWTAVGANAVADTDNTARVTKLVTGGYIGLADRADAKRRFLLLLQA